MGPGDRSPGMVCRAGTDSASDNAAMGPRRLPTITGVEMTSRGRRVHCRLLPDGSHVGDGPTGPLALEGGDQVWSVGPG